MLSQDNPSVRMSCIYFCSFSYISIPSLYCFFCNISVYVIRFTFSMQSTWPVIISMLRAYKICFTGVWHVQTKYPKLTCLWICANYRAEGTTQKCNIIFCYSHGHSLMRVLSSHWVSMNNVALISARPMMDQLTSWHYSKATLRSHTHNRTRGFSYAVSSCACGVANYVHWERRKLRISKVNYQNNIKKCKSAIFAIHYYTFGPGPYSCSGEWRSHLPA